MMIFFTRAHKCSSFFKMKYFILLGLLNVILGDIGISFDSKDDLYSSRFVNCTRNETNLKQCINGVCLSRIDTLEKAPFCLCLKGWDGSRCETSEIPSLPVTIERGCDSYVHVIIFLSTLIVCCSVGFSIFYIKKRCVHPLSFSR